MRTFGIFWFLFGFIVASGQNTWNHRLPLTTYGPGYSYMCTVPDGDGFLLASADTILQLDAQGTTTGYVGIATFPFTTFVGRRNVKGSDGVFFIVGRRITSQVNPRYALRIYYPPRNLLSEISLPDSLGLLSMQAPAVIDLNDSTIMVFGKNNAYQVMLRGDTAFSIGWQKPLSIPGTGACKAAVVTPGGFVLFTANGDVLGLSSEGQQVFVKKLPFAFANAAVLDDGIIASGATSDLKAVLVKLSFDGNIIWKQVYADTKYHDVSTTLDNSIVATGVSETGRIVLRKTDDEGNTIWTALYQPGFGVSVIPVKDGGYFLSTVVTTGFPARVYGIRTNSKGETAAPSDDFFVQNRQLRNADLKVGIGPSSSIFHKQGGSTTFITPADSATTVLSSFLPWIGGKDQNGQLHLAAEKFMAQKDFYSGVVGGRKGDFERVWLATQREIDEIRNDFLIDQELEQEVPYDLLTWPAKGNAYNRFNIDFTRIETNPDLFSAPFVDTNQDGVYNVFDGDYPQIKGDQMVYLMLNDDSTHFSSKGVPLKVDLNISAYLYDCAGSEEVNNTLFVDYQIINRSQASYDSMYFGFQTNFALGCYLDDKFGSIPDVSSYYTYNNDGMDEDCQGAQGFGGQIPVESICFVNQSLDHFIYYISPAFFDPPGNMLPPGVATHYYNYLKGAWKDGSPFTEGGGDFNPDRDTINYAYPSNPSDASGWSMCDLQGSYWEKLPISSHGPFTLGTSDTFNITIAFTTHHDIPLPCPDIFSRLNPVISQISTWANTGALEASPDLGIVQSITPGKKLTLDPGVSGAAFEWSTGATTPTLLVTQPGEYTVTVTFETGCQKVEKVSVIPALAPEHPAPDAGWFVYPNPADEYVTLRCPRCDENARRRVILRNALGAELLQWSSSAKSFDIPLHQFPSGFYWLECWQGDECWGNRKIMRVAR